MTNRSRVTLFLVFAVLVALVMGVAYLGLGRTIDADRMDSRATQTSAVIQMVDGPPTATATPMEDCTSPTVECACDHFLAGCTGGFPPEGEGVPFPTASATAGEKDPVPTDSNGQPCKYVDVDDSGALVCIDKDEVTVPECGEGEVFDNDFGCVATQLPEEHIGGVVTGPNGEDCTIIDAKGNTRCLLPDPPTCD